MSSVSEKCPVCGSPKSGWLDDNCPTCLMRLGAAGAPGGRPSSGAEMSDELAGAGSSPGLLGPRTGALRRLGDYELMEEIARGGMGVVYRARQAGLNRMVAVKVLLGGQFANPNFIERFRREAEAAASLSHPNIVSIHEVGEHDGHPYFSMELIEGRSLAELIRDQPPAARQAAQWLKTIAEAVHFAHERGVLHRDLKPSNVLVDAQGVPHITDFGLAKRLGVRQSSAALNAASQGAAEHAGTPHLLASEMKSATSLVHSKTTQTSEDDLTLTGQVLGSPNYMPPEQADPTPGGITAASDVYSLGAVLYHLLTGRPPFLAETVTQTLRLVGEGELVPPRLLNPSLSRDLETICLKCLEADPQLRYGTARELAEELGRFLRDEPIRARPISPLGRLARWRRRKPALAASLSAGALLLLVVLIGLPIGMYRIERAREAAEAVRRQETALRLRAESAERAAEAQLYTALLEQARATVRSGELGQCVRTLDAIRRTAEMTNTIELRREAFAALGLPDLRFERELPTGPDCTMAVLDPKFERLAIGRGSNAVEIRSVPARQLLTTLPASTTNLAIFGKWSPDGRFLGVCRGRSFQPQVRDLEVWDASSGQQRLFTLQMPWDAFSFHPTQPRILCPSAENWIVLYDLETGRELKRFSATGNAHHVEFSPDGQVFIVQHRIGGSQQQIGAEWYTSLYDASTGAQLSSVITGWIDGIVWHPQSRWIAFAARTGEVHLLDRKTGETRALGRHKSEARTAVFSPDGDFLFTGGEEQEIICWDLRLQQRVFNISLQSARLQFREDGGQCAVFTRSGALLHAFEHSVPYRELAGDLGGGLRHAAVSPDGRWLAVGGLLRLGLWDLTRATPAAMAWESEYAKPFFSPNGSELLALWGETLARWRIRPGAGTNDPPAALAPLPVPETSRVHFGQFISNSLVLCTQQGVHWAPPDAVTSEAADRLGANVVSGPTSGNGRWVVARFSRIAFVYELSPWKKLRDWHLDAESLPFVFTPRSDELAMVTMNGVTFLDTDNWEPKRSLSAPLDRNARLIFTPDGRAFWLARDARTAALHDIQTFETFLQLPSRMTPLALSPDGRHLALSVDTRRVQLWDLAEVRRRFRELGLDWVGR